ncbi:hypothetical protein [Streptomyces sp. NPDC001205]
MRATFPRAPLGDARKADVNEAAYAVHDGLAPHRVVFSAVAWPSHEAPQEPEAQAEAADADQTAADRLDRQIASLDGRSQHLHRPGGLWIRAVAVRYRETCLGYLVVRSLTTPSTEETALTDLLAQQTGVVLALLTGHRGEPAAGARDKPRTDETSNTGNPPEPEDRTPAAGHGSASDLASRLATHEAPATTSASSRRASTCTLPPTSATCSTDRLESVQRPPLPAMPSVLGAAGGSRERLASSR